MTLDLSKLIRQAIARAPRGAVVAVVLAATIGRPAVAHDHHPGLQGAAPTAHKGLRVETLGMIPARSMEKMLDLDGYVLQLRAITIEPGGQIAKHSHESRPGLVKVIGGEWTEGRISGEESFEASAPQAIIEDEDTVHWFWNRGDKPATAIVCDIVPASQ